MTIIYHKDLTQKILRSKLSYDKKTGRFVWINSRRNGWNGKIAGCKRTSKKKTYIWIKIDGVPISAHRLAWFYIHGYWPIEVDHKNGVSTDNWINNLKDCSHAENTQNHLKEKSNKRKLPVGVRDLASGRYEARISVNKKQIHLGAYTSIDEAEKVYQVARKKYHYCPARVSV